MQTYSAADLAVIEAPAVTVDFTVELLDADDQLVTDITSDVESLEVERDCFRTVHGKCKVRVARELLWESARIRPSAVIGDGTNTVTVPLGVFLLATPQVRAGESPQTFDVTGYDKLEVLVHPHGETFAAAAGDSYLDVVEALIVAAGETAINLDPAGAALTLPADRAWPIDQRTTTLSIINELLAGAAYRPLWADPSGTFRSVPDVDPSTEAPSWTYDTGSESTTVTSDRTLDLDLFGVPNRWVFVRDDPAQDFPAVGAGIYTVTNQSDGASSIDARGRTITRVEKMRDVASQTELEIAGDRIAEADRRVSRHVSLGTSPNPLHGHRDVVRLVDAELGVDANFVVGAWRLALDGTDMQLDLREVS